MTTTISMQELQDVFTYPFKDPQWKKKFAIGMLIGVFNILIFPAFFLNGYGYRVMRGRIVDRKPLALPEWEDWGGLFLEGLRLYAVGFIYSLPATLVMVTTYLVTMIPMMRTDQPTSIPLWLPIVLMLGMGLAMVLALPAQVILPVAITNMTVKDRFAAAFYLRELWRLFSANKSRFLLTAVLSYAANLAFIFALQLVYITLVLCITLPVLIPLGGFYLITIHYALYAWAYQGTKAVNGFENGLNGVDSEAVESS